MKIYIGCILILMFNTVIAQIKETPVLIYGGIVDDRIIHNVSTDDSKSIYLIRGNTKLRIWKDNNTIYKISLSPNNRYVAFISENEQHTSHAFTLAIIDTTGRLIKEINDGHVFSWSPDGNRIVYELALKRDEGMGYNPIETEIFDITTNTTKRLGFKTYDIYWAMFDNKIYYLNYSTGRVLTYDDLTKEVNETTLKGINISPDGKYCFRSNYEGGEFALFSINNQEITQSIIQKTGITYVQQPQWVESSVLLLRNQSVENHAKSVSIVYDISSQTISKFEGSIVGSCSSDNVVGVVDKNGKISLSSLAEIFKSEK